MSAKSAWSVARLRTVLRVVVGSLLALLSIHTAVRATLVDDNGFLPHELLPVIAAIEGIFALAFVWRGSMLSVAGLWATFGAAAVLHVTHGERAPWPLLVYALVTLALATPTRPVAGVPIPPPRSGADTDGD